MNIFLKDIVDCSQQTRDRVATSWPVVAPILIPALVNEWEQRAGDTPTAKAIGRIAGTVLPKILLPSQLMKC